MTTADTLTREWGDVPAAMEILYVKLREMGFVNTTAPTPDEWELPGKFQVRVNHVARETHVRYRATPPAPPEPIHSIDGQLAYDKRFPWSERIQTQHCALEEFRAFLLASARLIGTEIRMLDSQSRY